MVYKKQNGFTIIELMIAITVFTTAIVLVTTGVIQLGRLYKHGTVRAKLVTTSREIHAQFAQDLQYSGKDVAEALLPPLPAPSTQKVVCLGTTRYRVIIDASAPNYGDLSVEKIAGPNPCDTIPTVSTQKPLPANSRVTTFTLVPPTNSSGAYTLTTRMVTGQQDMFVADDYNKPCKSAPGKEFCAVVELTSVIARKVEN